MCVLESLEQIALEYSQQCHRITMMFMHIIGMRWHCLEYSFSYCFFFFIVLRTVLRKLIPIVDNSNVLEWNPLIILSELETNFIPSVTYDNCLNNIEIVLLLCYYCYDTTFNSNWIQFMQTDLDTTTDTPKNRWSTKKKKQFPLVVYRKYSYSYEDIVFRDVPIK